jgi:hypothetical protein
MGQYRPMFNISMEHTYFSGGKFSGVDLIPTAETAKIMLNANLVTRKRPDGITVFLDNDYLDALRLYAQDEDDPLKINFECEVAHPNFQNFTNSAAFAENKTLFFDSSNTDGSSIGKKYLHSEEHVSSSDLAENFTGPHRLNENHGSFLRFSQNRALLFDNEQTENNPTGKMQLNIDDASQGIELAKGLMLGASPASGRLPSLGLVSISITEEELDQLTQSPPQVCNDYHIRFKARETHWKYFLVGDANREGAFVKDANGEIEFDDLGEEVLANGRSARVFISREAIPLRNRAKAKFQLQIPKNNRIKVLVNRLAVASAKRINRVKIEDQELFVSEIYINF